MRTRRSPPPIMRVLNIFELARSILGELDGRDLLNAQAVYRLMCQHVRGIKQDLTKGGATALKAHHAVTKSTRLHPLLRFIMRSPFEHTLCDPDLGDHLHTFFVELKSKTNSRLWQDVFVSCPPVTSVGVLVHEETDTGAYYEVRPINQPEGVTMGDDVDKIKHKLGVVIDGLCMLVLGDRKLDDSAFARFDEQFSAWAEMEDELIEFDDEDEWDYEDE